MPATVAVPAVSDASLLDAPTAAAAIGAIAAVFGLLSFELFGHTFGVITDNDAYFDLRVDELANQLGL